MIDAKKVSAMLPRTWKKLFNSGVIIPTKLRFCNERNNENCCDRCNNQITEIKEFEANLNQIKRQPPNELGHILPCFENKVIYL